MQTQNKTLALIIALALPGFSQMQPAVAQDYKLGGITVTAPWARATPGGAQVAVAFLEIQAAPGVEDKLIGARTPAAGSVELHDHINDAGVMKMRRIEGIPIKGAQSVVLKPGGLHAMLIDLKVPLKEGDKVTFTLIFEKAGDLQIDVPVAKIGAGGPTGAPATDGHQGHGSAHGKGH